jgi:hypothetical protein
MLRRLFALQPLRSKPGYGVTVATPSHSVVCKVKSWPSQVKTESSYLCNLTSDLCNVYNGWVPDEKPFRLTESVKAAG